MAVPRQLLLQLMEGLHLTRQLLQNLKNMMLNMFCFYGTLRENVSEFNLSLKKLPNLIQCTLGKMGMDAVFQQQHS